MLLAKFKIWRSGNGQRPLEGEISMKQYIVKNSAGNYLFKILKTWYYFTDNIDHAKLFTKKEATELAKQFKGEIQKYESGNN